MGTSEKDAKVAVEHIQSVHMRNMQTDFHHSVCIDQASKQLPFDEEREKEIAKTRPESWKVIEKIRELEDKNLKIKDGKVTEGASTAPPPLLQHVRRGI